MSTQDQRPEAPVIPDAPPDNWVDRYAPPATRPYLRLSRADRPIGTWLLLIPCWWGALLGALAAPDTAGWLTLWVLVACALGSVLMRGAGCTWNDMADRDLDAQVARTRARPLASGQVTVPQAALWMAAQMAISALILFSFNWNAVWLGIAALIPVAIYPFAKRFTWWPQAFLGIAFNWGVLVAWTAQTGSLGLPAVLIYAGGIVWTLFYDTIYAHQDREDDALIGIKSTARLFGSKTELWLRGFLVTTVLLLSLGVIVALAPRPDPIVMALALAGVWAMGWHMHWQLGKLDISAPSVCLAVFRSNRDAGLLVALFLAAAIFA